MNADELVDWKTKGPSDGPLMFFDAMWSLFSNHGDFYRLLERTMPGFTRKGLAADSALAESLKVIFAEVVPLQRQVMSDALGMLRRKGMPGNLLTPERFGTDWGSSQLNSSGLLTLRLCAWYSHGRGLSEIVYAEGQTIVVFPRPVDDPILGVRGVISG